MTQHLPTDDLANVETNHNETIGETPKVAVPTFKFPFAPANFAPQKTPSQPWHQKGNNARHEKKIGMAPKGTRRSMGKR